MKLLEASSPRTKVLETTDKKLKMWKNCEFETTTLKYSDAAANICH